MAGGDIADPDVVDAVMREALPRVERLPGYLGSYLFVDRERPAMLGVTFWEDEDALAGAVAVGNHNAGAVMAMTSAESVQMWSCDLVHSRPPDPAALLRDEGP
ncbi:hypothetical protein [Nocardioides sp.]|uniref:hypothetical protein n=1 Tax=Nocardioides sp. TaxID=35761 RepID=UPI003784C377